MSQLQDQYEMSQEKVAEQMYLCKNTVMRVEKQAIQKFKEELEKRGIQLTDLLGN